MARIFEDKAAKRERVPLLVGLAGVSGCGKTYSALELATGMLKVVGGQTYVIDTESRRALHYADRFPFRHIEFGPPYSPTDYMKAIQHCVSKGASVVIVDSMSHEHEGPGGVLEMHDAELTRMAGEDYQKRQKMTYAAWVEPKQQRRRLINEILRLGCNLICCFRGKEKLDFKQKPPKPLGIMPIAGEEFVYEMTVNVMLPAASGGIPNWNPEFPGEKAMTKLPVQFKGVFEKSRPLNQEIGEALARWAAGDEAPEPRGKAADPAPGQPIKASDVIEAIWLADTKEAVHALAKQYREAPWATEERQTIKNAITGRMAQLSEQEPSQPKSTTISKDEPCTHPDGYSADLTGERICIHCGLVEGT
jgi:hypothetical protein